MTTVVRLCSLYVPVVVQELTRLRFIVGNGGEIGGCHRLPLTLLWKRV